MASRGPNPVFSPQRLDAAASLSALFADPALVDSPSEALQQTSHPPRRRGGSTNAYATPTYVLTHEDDLLQHNGRASFAAFDTGDSSSSSSSSSSNRSKNHGTQMFPVPDFFATPALGMDKSDHDDDTTHSGRKTKKIKKKRARTSASGSFSSASNRTKKQKVAKAVVGGSSRKLKALGLLCARFIIMHYNSKPGATEIKLSELSEMMGIERRRMYDCLNILESIKLVHKKRKDIYVW